MSKVESIQHYLEPVRKTITVNRPCEDAFRIFTAEIAAWWPTVPFSVSQESAKDVILEPRVGGLLYEVSEDGSTFPWGEVLVWDSPHRLVLTWYPGREPDTAQEIEITFSTEANGTRVDLEHRNWQSLGAEAESIRGRYQNGWDEVFGQCYVSACRS